MNNLRQMCAAAILTLLVTVSALAGQIQCPGAPSPTPGGTSITTTVVLTIIGLIR